ncbi:sulfotransferase family cytosolic 1B member 1-like [Bradysia coprophila]|uniref:sulfotransferase family cytosolic 1B member 1-like n=1 Tax=Bradysia coprophila TaxID=38358 RepID=UPI00187D7E55|nr:sulfotransferase family cytosolic 1B member 1-like [Bradysia coprophila]
MTYSVQSVANGTNFEFPFHHQFKYILNKIPNHPLQHDVQSKFNSITMPRAYEQYMERIWNCDVYEDDTWVITYPKCGTTWTQEAVWQICNDVDLDDKGKTSIRQRFPFIEIQAVTAFADRENPFDFINELQRPRFIKSHLPICFLPKQLWQVKPKIVYVAREPKDAAISFYHHYYNMYKYCGTKNEFLDSFLHGIVEHGCYWDHVEQFHLLRPHYPNLLFITFENMKHNLEHTLNELCNFLDKTLTAEQLQRLANHLQFDNMKKNPAVNPPYIEEAAQKNRPGSGFAFVRRGITGSYKDEMTPEYVRKFNEMTKKRFETLGLYQSD